MKGSRLILNGLLAALLLAVGGCQQQAADGTPDYPVTIIAPGASSVAPTALPEPSATAAPQASPTLDWSVVTVLPLPTTAGGESAPEAAEGETEPAGLIPDPLTEANVELLAAAGEPFTLSDAEISLGRLVLPVDLLSVEGAFSVRSVEIEDYAGWRFLAFDLPTPADGELGPVVRAPISGEVWPGTMQMINNQTVQTVSIDHALGDDQLVRATFVYSGTVEPLYVLGQQVQAGEVIFRLTRDTGRFDTLGSTPIPGENGAILTLHASIDTVVNQESGTQSLKFLRGISWTPEQFVRDEEGLILAPATTPQ